MSQDKERTVPNQDDVVLTVSRRRFLQGIGATVGVVVAGTLPAIITAKAASATDPTTTTSADSPVLGGEAENPLAEVIAQDRPVNYPGRPVYYAKPAGKRNGRWSSTRRPVWVAASASTRA